VALALPFATAVVYTNDVESTVAFYASATGLVPTYYDRELGFAMLGEEQAVSVASHAAGALMLEAGYAPAAHARVRGTELAFWTEDVAAAFRRAVDAGATPLAPPRTMPWGQTVAYVEAPEGTIRDTPAGTGYELSPARARLAAPAPAPPGRAAQQRRRARRSNSQSRKRRLRGTRSRSSGRDPRA
jgi:lactoylglutathione lyase